VSIIRRMRPHEKTISVGGTYVHTWVGGQGDPLLVLHGAGGNRGWRQWMERVAEHYTVWAPTHPGFGASGDAEWMEGVDDLARFYLWWMDATRLERPHLLGQSLGGWTAAEMATMNPGAIDRLVLAAPVGLKPETGEILDVFYHSPQQLRELNVHDPSAIPEWEELFGRAPTPVELEIAERNRAVLKAPSSLDAWEAHHRGLWHMYRFNRDDNQQAQHFFEQALRLDPTFSRPYAGLSFTHFQSAFLGWGERAHEVEQAYAAASRGLMADEQDPAAHWAMGRALWLHGRVDESLTELDTSVELSPNFALGHYTLAFIHAQSGDPQAAIREADHSRDLSPFDPLLFAMLATRALALVRLSRFDEAADWAAKAAARPNAHVHVLAIGAHCLALAGRVDAARTITATIHARQPGYRVDDFLTAFRFTGEAEALIRRAATLISLA